jgi:hypothetical protein
MYAINKTDNLKNIFNYSLIAFFIKSAEKFKLLKQLIKLVNFLS